MLIQEGVSISGSEQLIVDPTLDLTFGWDPFSDGGPLDGSDWVDLHFLLIDNCHGEYVYSGGAPGGEKNVVLDYTVTNDTMPASLLEPGMQYVAFLSRVNFRDYDRTGIAEQLAANSFAVELPFRTSGITQESRACPTPHLMTDYRFSKKSPEGEGLATWPTIKVIESRTK